MTRIECLQRSKDHSLDMLERLLVLIDGYRPGMPGYPIFMQLNRLYGLVRVHFVQQEAGLYTELEASNDAHVARLARAFAMEMDDLAIELERFAKCWSSSVSISCRFDEFREAAFQIVLKLAVWFEREDQIIFPLAGMQQKAAA